MPLTFHKLACVEEAGMLGPKAGVPIINATAAMVVPSQPPHLKEAAEGYLLVAGDVGPMGQALDSGLRWMRASEFDVEGEGGAFPQIRDVVAFRLAHVCPDKAELTYSIRKE